MRKITKWALATAALLSIAPSRGISGVFYEDGATTMHFAFEGSPNGDRPVVRPPQFFKADDGFGFVDSPLLIGTANGVTAPKYFRFDVNLPDGNYDVSIIFGGTRGESITTVKAEGHRPMLLNIRASGRQTATGTFTVNVRHGVVGPDEHDGWLDLDGRLNLEFAGVNPSLEKLDIQPNDTAITVYLAGDSTVCDQDNIPFAGWGEMLPILFKPGEVAVANYAGADQTVQFLQTRLDEIGGKIKAGDYLFVQSDNNGEFPRPDEVASYQADLQKYIDVARQHHATAVLVTPVPHRRFDPQGKVRYDDYCPQATRDLAAEQKVPLIDLTAAATAFLQQLGPDGSTKAFAYYPANTFPGQSQALADDNEFNAYGAYELAKMVAQGIQEDKLDLASHLSGDITTNPDPAKFPKDLGYEYLLTGK